MVDLKVVVPIAVVAIIVVALVWYHNNVAPITMPLVATATVAPSPATATPMSVPVGAFVGPVGYMASTAAPMATLNAHPTDNVLVASVAPMSL